MAYLSSLNPKEYILKWIGDEINKSFSYEELKVNFLRFSFTVKGAKLKHTKFDSYPTIEICDQSIDVFKGSFDTSIWNVKIEIQRVFIHIQLLDATDKVRKKFGTSHAEILDDACLFFFSSLKLRNGLRKIWKGKYYLSNIYKTPLRPSWRLNKAQRARRVLRIP
jgi:hypothetical protein